MCVCDFQTYAKNSNGFSFYLLLYATDKIDDNNWNDDDISNVRAHKKERSLHIIEMEAELFDQINNDAHPVLR